MNCKVPGKIDHPVLLRRVCGGDNELNPHKTFLFWNQPTPQFLPAEFHRQRSLVATVHGVAKSWTRLSSQHFQFTFYLYLSIHYLEGQLPVMSVLDLHVELW